MTIASAIISDRLTHSDIDRIRCESGRSLLLFITDRCPVGCAHCSVDSRKDSAKISDFGLFEEIVAWVADQPRFEVVGISGGEPFVERRGLELASRAFADAGKRTVVFTSGTWARQKHAPRWIQNVLAHCASVYLSTDSFHAKGVSDANFVNAARAVTAAGCWLIVQGLNDAESPDRIEGLLRLALGDRWSTEAEINLVKPLSNGRGNAVFQAQTTVPGHALGTCSLVRNPMIRYDGRVSACCNESVIMGLGPDRLRRRITAGAEIDRAMRSFEDDDLLQVVGGVGLGALTAHPILHDLAERRFTTNCALCWSIFPRFASASGPTDRLITAMAALQKEVVS